MSYSLLLKVFAIHSTIHATNLTHALPPAMAAHDRDGALAIHVDLLTKGSLTDDIGLWMSGLKQLILRL